MATGSCSSTRTRRGSLTAWHRARQAETPVVVAVSLTRLGAALDAAAADGYVGAIVDLPGALGPGEAALSAARPSFSFR